MTSSRLGRGMAEQGLAGLLLLSLGAIVYAAGPWGRMEPRRPAPMRVHTEAISPELWRDATGRGHITGAHHAADTMVVFMDYECPVCARKAAVLDSILAVRPNLAVLYRHFPLQSHSYAFEEAILVECAAHQELLAPAQRLMYSRRGPVDIDGVVEALGAQSEVLRACVTSRTVLETIEADRQLAVRVGVPGTPGVLFSGERWSHLPNLDQLTGLVP